MLSAVEKKSDQVYRWLLAYIDENKFSGNQRLPSENALCRKLGVSRETIRVAIDQLVAEGLVYKLKGSGTYFHREKVMTRDLNTEEGYNRKAIPRRTIDPFAAASFAGNVLTASSSNFP